MENTIRFAQITDIESITAIYNYYVTHTTISFEMKAPDKAEMLKRFESISKHYPWLVYEENDKVVGYAYASQHRIREAYQWAADVTVYLDPGAEGKGYGTALYTELIKLLTQQGFYNAYAGIALPNKASVALHEKLGFQKIAEYNKVGYKQGEWWNVGWWELHLKKHQSSPSKPNHVIDDLKTSS